VDVNEWVEQGQKMQGGVAAPAKAANNGGEQKKQNSVHSVRFAEALEFSSLLASAGDDGCVCSTSKGRSQLWTLLSGIGPKYGIKAARAERTDNPKLG